MTDADAQRYLAAYEHAIHAIGARRRRCAASYAGPGISVKLSALHPRYARAQRERVMAELVPARARGSRSSRAATTSASTSMPRKPTGSSFRSTSSTRSRRDPALAGWHGLGFVVQAYQKRARARDRLARRARRARHRRRLMVRLVKGAYWDTEIKRAQVDGLADYPVFTRKVHTDVVVPRVREGDARGARRALSAVRDHNAFTIAAIHTLAGDARLRVPVPARHGRDASTTRSSATDKLDRRVPHLRAGRLARDAARVPRAAAARERRQLARSSTASSIPRSASRSSSPIPWRGRAARGGTPHPRIPLPVALYPGPPQFARRSISPTRRRCARCERSSPTACRRMRRRSRSSRDRRRATARTRRRSRNPADRDDLVGTVDRSRRRRRRARRRASPRRAGRAWSRRCRPRARAHASSARPICSKRSARRSCALAVREAGKTLANAHRRSARGRRLLPLLRGAGARASSRARRRAARSPASRRGIFRWRSSSGRSAPRSPPAIPCSRSPPSRRR